MSVVQAISSFEESDFQISPTSVFLGELVGKGNFSKVFKGLYLGSVVAIKKQEITDDELERYLLNELAILRFCNHAHIVKYIGASKPNEKVMWSITEYIPGGDFRMLLKSRIQLSWSHIVEILYKASDALYYLHSKNIIHRDIKTDNIMLTLNMTPKLIDLGFAREVEPLESSEEPERAMTCLGTDEFMAPEVTFALPYHLPADVFSFGITISEACLKRIPERTPRNGFCLEWEETRKDLKEAGVPESLALLIEHCAADNVIDRLTMQGVVEWLEELDGDLKEEQDKPDSIQLSEDEVLKTLHAKWENILKNGESDPNATLKLDPSDLETGFLASGVPEGELDTVLKKRRISVNKALKYQAERVTEEEENYDSESPEGDEESKAEYAETELGSEVGTPKRSLPTLSVRSRTQVKRNKEGQRSESYSVRGNLRSIVRKMSHGGEHSLNAVSRLGRAVTDQIKGMNSSLGNLKAVKRQKPKYKQNGHHGKRGKVPFKSGTIYRKYTFGFLTWRKELMVLTGEGLLYFKNQAAKERSEVKGALLFMDMTANPITREPAIRCSIAQAGKPDCFMILTKEKKKLFQAQSNQDRNDWIRRINRGYQLWHKTEMLKKMKGLKG